jgi:hypothetical protein
MKYIKWLSIGCLAFWVAGCGTTAKKAEVIPGPGKIAQTPRPDWVMKGTSAFPGDPNTVIYGVGVMNAQPNIALQRKASDNRAREDVAATMKTTVASLIKDFMEHHVDYFNTDTASSDEFVSYVSKSVTDATLINCKIVDRWEDADTGALYSLARFDLNDSFYDTYKNKLKAAIREQHGAIVKERAEEAIKTLDTEIEKQRANEKDILGIK